jgi:transcriptional regulator with XRE-family HTH domain
MPSGEDLRRARRAADLTLDALAQLGGLSASHLSRIESGKRPVTPATVALYARAAGADLAEEVALERPARAATGSLHPRNANIHTDPVNRRDLLALTGATLTGIEVGQTKVAGLHSLAGSLTSYGLDDEAASGPPLTVGRAHRAVYAAKHDYQACRYRTVVDTLPRLLTGLRVLSSVADGEERSRADALSADAHHVAASVLLKLDDVGLAALAADRSMEAARRSGDPVVIASGARIVTHALMASGHGGRASELATRAADALRPDICPRATDPVISSYGALLLRGAVAAARHDDRDTAHGLIEGAAEAASVLGRDGNERFTGFGPTNVQLHRVNIALTLGDAGTAIDLARRVDLTKVTLIERKASLLLDVAQAYLQWQRWGHALAALRAVLKVAPDELRARPATRRLVVDLARQGPRSIRAEVAALAAQADLRL